MTNAFIERLARALDPEAWDQVYFDKSTRFWRRDNAEKSVRAILLAMREPSEEMLRSETGALPDAMQKFYSDAQDVWQAMIDAALKE